MSEREKVLAKLQKLNIYYEMTEHPIVHTIEEMRKLGICDQGTVCKNLFLRDQKGNRHFLVILDNQREIAIQSMRDLLHSTRLSFGSDERLERCMKLKSGAVGPFGLLNDPDNKVEVVIDANLKESERLGFHPNDNTATVWISHEDFMKYIRSTNHQVFILE